VRHGHDGSGAIGQPAVFAIENGCIAPVLPDKTQLLADDLSSGAPWLPFREKAETQSEALPARPLVSLPAMLKPVPGKGAAAAR